MATSYKKRKISGFLIIGVLVVLLYGKNLLERQSFRTVSSTLSDVYEDRLLVESYIFQISEKLFTIQKLVDQPLYYQFRLFQSGTRDIQGGARDFETCGSL